MQEYRTSTQTTEMMNDPLVYLNGDMTPLSAAKIPVLDRGFIFGDGIYEVIPIYGRKPFRAEQHMARLFRSMAAVGIANPHSKQEWMNLFGLVVAAFPADDQMVYMQVTRGVAKRAHVFPANTAPTVFIMPMPMALPSATLRDKGAACISMQDKRWLRCEIKSTSLLGSVLAAQEASEHHAIEAIQFRDGFLTEGSSSNVWVAKDGKLFGPPRDNLILEGIRYGLIEEICASTDIPFEARRISRDEVFAADEVLLSSATKEVLAVATIDGHTIGKGAPGPIFKKLYEAYQNAISAL